MRDLGTISHLHPINGNRDSPPMPARDPHPDLPGTKCLPGTLSGTVRIYFHCLVALALMWVHWCLQNTQPHPRSFNNLNESTSHSLFTNNKMCLPCLPQSEVLKEPGLRGLPLTLTCCVNFNQFLNFSEPQFSSWTYSFCLVWSVYIVSGM